MGELMETLRSHLSKVRIPQPSERIFKHECCVSFSTRRSEGGLFVDLCTFLAFGKEYVTLNYVKTGDPVYLNIQETQKQVSDDRPNKKPKLLAIGVEGGSYSKDPEYEETYSIVVLPDFISLPYPSVELPEKVRLAVDGVLAAVGEERKEVVAADKKVSKYSSVLQQVMNGVTVPPTGWKCSKCDETENLWMNLTDGTILCGPRNRDGSGGNNHTFQYYQETGYPLAVKLGTITEDLKRADVYSYAEDDTVEDPLLADHLAHFGIDFSALRKIEMTTAERELDQNTNFVKPLFGPGFTGLSNLGNSCYLASVMQAVFSTKDFQEIYYENMKLDDAFKQAPADPTRDLHMQLSKLAHGILSGKYSAPPTMELESEAAEEPKDKNALTSLLQGQDGISPRMFKSLIGTGHPEFASSRQQDALQFFQHLMDQVEKSHGADAWEDPSRCFKFRVEERIMCSVSKKVKYTWKTDNALSLSVPLEAAVNKDEVDAYEKRVAEKKLAGEKSDEKIVCPRVPLAACLERYSAPEEVQDFYSSAINARTTAIKTTRLSSFPKYLVLKVEKLVLKTGWVSQKYDVFVDVPDEIDITDMSRSHFEPDEKLLPDAIAVQAAPTLDQAIVSQLADMGSPRVPDDSSSSNKITIETLDSDLEEVTNWLLPPPSDSEESVAIDVGTGNHDTEQEVAAADSSGRYQLLAIVSHIGTSTQSGHCVAHVRKKGSWAIFDDCKVARSGAPPKDKGYLYFFQRIPSKNMKETSFIPF